MTEEQWNELINSDEGIKEAAKILLEMSNDPKQWEIQEKRIKFLEKQRAEYNAYYNKGKEIGKKEEMLKNALRMKGENIPDETIIKITGLSAEQVALLL